MSISTAEQRQKTHALLDEARAILTKADGEKRGLTLDERREYDQRKSKIDELSGEIDNNERRNELERAEAEIEIRKLERTGASGPTFRNPETGEYVRGVKHGESFRSATKLAPAP